MSTTIDNRVVSMEFDNAKFEKGIAQTLESLNKLNDTINKASESSTKSFGDIVKQLGNMSFGAVEKSINGIANAFTFAGQFGLKAFSLIQDKMLEIMSIAPKFIKSLSVDQINAGWDKYAQKTSYVQTIFNAVKDNYYDESYAMAAVNEQLDKLMWFTDETSYNFVDLVSTMGKFTAQEIDLKTAATAMEGISNWAASAGRSAQDATHATYNLAQALGQGSVKLQDWKSISNVNMDTKEFKEAALEMAAALGELEKVTEGVYKTTKGTEVTVASFGSSLKEEWFTTEVLIDVLGQYGSVTDKIYDLSVATGAEATEILELVDAAKEEQLTIEMLEDTMNGSVISVEDYADAILELADAENEFGINAFRAGQEAKTFKDAIDATTDAVSSKWMQTFELLFGQYDEAKHLWTDLAGTLYEVFAAPVDSLNDLIRASNTTGWDTITQKIVDTGGSIEAFEDNLSKVAKEHGVIIDQWIEEDGSFADTLWRNWLTLDDVSEALELMKTDSRNVISSVSEANMTVDEFRQLAEQIWNGDYGHGDAAVAESLEALGYNAEQVIHLSNLLIGGHEITEESLIGIKTAVIETTASFDDLIAEASNAESEMAQAVNDVASINAHDYFIASLYNIMDTLTGGIEVIREAWSNVFPPATADTIRQLSVWFYNLTESVRVFVTENEEFKWALQGSFSILNGIISVVKAVFAVVKPLISFLGGTLLGIITKIFSAIGKMSNAIRTVLGDAHPLLDIFKGLGDILQIVLTKLKEFGLTATGSLGSGALLVISRAISSVIDGLKSLGEKFSSSIFQSERAEKVLGKLSNFYHKFIKRDLEPGTEKIEQTAEDAEKTVTAFDKLKNSISSFSGKVFSPITNAFSRIKNDANAFIKGELTFKNMLSGWADSLKNKVVSLKDALFGVAEGENKKSSISEKINALFATDENGVKFSGLKSTFKNATEYIKGLFTKLKESNFSLGDFILEKMNNLSASLQEARPKIQEAVTNFFVWLKEFIGSAGGIVGEIGGILFDTIKTTGFSISDMISTYIGSLWNAFKKPKNSQPDITLEDMGIDLETATESLSNWVTKNSDGNVFSPIKTFVESIRSFFKNDGSLKKSVTDYFSGLSNSLNDTKESFKTSVSNFVNDLSNTFNDIKNFLFGSEGLLTTKLSNFIKVFVGHFNEIKPVISSLLGFDAIFTGLNWVSSIKNVNKSISGFIDKFGLIGSSISDTIGSFKKIPEGIKEALLGTKDAFKSLMESLGKTFDAFAKSLGKSIKIASKGFSKAIKKIGRGMEFKMVAQGILYLAIAIGVLAGEMYLLSKVNPEEMLKGALNMVIAMVPLVAAIIIVSKSLGKLGTEKGKIAEAALFIAVFAAVITAMVIVARLLAGINFGKFVKGVIELAIISGLLVGVVALFAVINKKIGPAQMTGMAVTLIAFSVAVGILAKVVKSLSEVADEDNKKKLTLAVEIVERLIFFLAAAMAISRLGTANSLSSGFVKFGIEAILLASAVSILAKAIKKIATSGASTKEISQAGITLSIVTLAFYAFTKLVNECDGLEIGKALSVILLAESISVLFKSLRKMVNLVKRVGETEIFKAEMLLGALELMFGAYLIIVDLSNMNIRKAIGAIAAVGSIYAILCALEKFQNMDVDPQTLIGFGGILLAAGGAIALVGLGLKLLATGLSALIVPLALIGVVAAGIVALGAVAFKILGWGLGALADSMTADIGTIVSGFTTLGNNKQSISDGMDALGTLFGKSIGTGLLSIINNIFGNYDSMTTAANSLADFLAVLNDDVITKLTGLPEKEQGMLAGIDVVNSIIGTEAVGAKIAYDANKKGEFDDMKAAAEALSSFIGYLTDEVIEKLIALPEKEDAMVLGVNTINNLIDTEKTGAHFAKVANKKGSFNDMIAAGDALASFVKNLEDDVIDKLIALPEKEEGLKAGVETINTLIDTEREGAKFAKKGNKWGDFEDMKAAGDSLADFVTKLSDDVIDKLVALPASEDLIVSGVRTVGEILGAEKFPAIAAEKGNDKGSFEMMKSAGEGLSDFLQYVPTIIENLDLIKIEDVTDYETKMDMLGTFIGKLGISSIFTNIGEFISVKAGKEDAFASFEEAAKGFVDFCVYIPQITGGLDSIETGEIENYSNKVDFITEFFNKLGWSSLVTGLSDFVSKLTGSESAFSKYDDIAIGIIDFCSYADQLFPALLNLKQYGTNAEIRGVITKIEAVTSLAPTTGIDYTYLGQIGSGLAELATGISMFDSETLGTLSTITNKITELLFGNVEESSENPIVDKAKGILNLFASGFKDNESVLTEAIDTIIPGAISSAEAYNGEAGEWYTTGVNASEGYKQGVLSKADEIAEAAAKVVRDAIAAAQREQHSNSPSKVFTQLGSYAGQGYAIGLTKETHNVENSASGIVNSAIKVAQRTSELIQNTLNSDYVPTITPVIDTSGVYSGIQSINSMTSGMHSVSLSSSIAGHMNAIQNAGTPPQVVTLDSSSMAAFVGSRQTAPINNNLSIGFTGDLAQLASVLHPYLVAESNRVGPTFIKGVR